MKDPLPSASAVLAAALAMLAAASPALVGFDPLAAGALSALGVAWAGCVFGARPAVLAALLTGGGLAFARYRAGLSVGVGDVALLPALGAVGASVGFAAARLRERLGRTEDALRRALREERASGPGNQEPPAAAGCPPMRTGSDPLALVEGILEAENPDRAVAELLAAVVSLDGVEGAVWFLHDRGRDRLRPGTDDRGGRVDPEPFERALRRSARERRVVQFSEGSGPGRRLRAAVPVHDRALTVGFLALLGAAPIPEETARAAATLAQCFAVRRSQLEAARKLEASAQTDPVTGLKVGRAFHEDLQRAAESGRFALLLAAPKGMGSVNRRSGRDMGDRLLEALARLVVLEVGKKGTVGRLGGAALGVVLPGATREGVLELAERLARRVERSLSTGARGGGIRLAVAVACGRDASGPQVLVEAEEALARAAEGEETRIVEAAPESERSGV